MRLTAGETEDAGFQGGNVTITAGAGTNVSSDATTGGGSGGAVVVEGGFSSAVDLGATAYPWLPVRWFMLDKFVNTRWAEALPQVTPSRASPHTPAARARSLARGPRRHRRSCRC